MAGSGKRGGGDRVLESRHLVGLFLGVVLLCGVFFTLGYVMGRNQFGGSVHASDSAIRNVPSSSPKPKAAEQPGPTAPDWDFYPNGNKKDTDHLTQPAPAVKSPPAPSATAKPVPRRRSSSRAQARGERCKKSALAAADNSQERDSPANCSASPTGRRLGNGGSHPAEKVSLLCRYAQFRQLLSRASRPLSGRSLPPKPQNAPSNNWVSSL